MGDIRRPSHYVSGDSDPIIFIQCVNGRYPMAHKLCSHGLDGIGRDVRPTSQVDIPTVSVG